MPHAVNGVAKVRHDLATEQQLQHTPSFGIPDIPEELITVWGTGEILNKHLLSDIYCLFSNKYLLLFTPHNTRWQISQSPSMGPAFIRNSVTLL